MPDFDDEEFDANSEEGDADEQAARFEAELERQVALMPPQLYDNLKPLLLLGAVANYMLLGHPDDPVPLALKELLDYDHDALQTVLTAQDTPSLARVMAAHTLPLFDFIMVGRLVFESALEAPLRTYLARQGAPGEDFAGSRGYMLTAGEALLENLGQFLTRHDEDLREDLRMRRLQTESIFARLDDTLRPFYPPGHAPAAQQALALDDADAAEDAAEPSVYVSFNNGQRLTLATALRLPYLLAELGETPFARALAGVARFRQKALDRLAARLETAPADEPFGLTWSELLRLYQAAQVCALSTVTDVLATGSLEDAMAKSASEEPDGPADAATYARHAREVMTAMLAGFVEVVEVNHPGNAEVAAAKAEISQLAELLLE